MKKLITTTILVSLSLLSFTFQASAEGLNVEQWDAYCKASQENKKRCRTAYQVCEEYENADCDQIKLAIMQRRSLDPIVNADK